MLLAPHSVVRSNFLKRHEIIAVQAKPLKHQDAFFPSPLHDPLAHACNLHCMLMLFGTKLATLPPSDLMSVSDPLPALAIHVIANCGLRYSSQVLMI